MEETRSIDELLRMDSYQDMTDEEINTVIMYRAALAATSVEAVERQRILENGLRDIQQQAQEAAQMARNAFNAACSIAPEFKRIEVE